METIPAILGLVLLIGAVQCGQTRDVRLTKASPDTGNAHRGRSESVGAGFASTSITEVTSQVTTSPSEMSTVVSHSTLTSEASSTKMTLPVNMSTESVNMTTQQVNMTTHTTNLTTLPVNSSSVSPFTSPSHITSETTVTSRTSHAVLSTTPSSAPLPREKKGFEAWSFLGGVAVGLGMTLACVGLVYCITTKKMYSTDSVQYKAM